MSRPAVLATVFAALTLSAATAHAAISFAPARALPIDAGADTLVTADLNRDGDLDVIAVSTAAKELRVFLGAPDLPAALTPGPVLHVGSSLQQAAAGDLDADGVPDLACTDSAAGAVWILIGRGDGTFQEPYKVNVGRHPLAIAIADVDARNGTDLIVADDRMGRVFVRLNDGATPPGFDAEVAIAVGEEPVTVLALDVNRDRRPDVVTLNLGGPRVKTVAVSLLLAIEDGTPRFETPRHTTIVGTRPFALLAAELSGDDTPDLVLLNQPSAGTPEIVALHNDGAGTFTPAAHAVPCPFFTGGFQCRVLALAAGDFDRDNRVDLAVALSDPRGGAVQQDVVQIFAGRGDGRVVPGPVFAVGKQPTALVAAQLNRDCRLDLLVGSDQLQVLTNQSRPGVNLHGNGDACVEPPACLSGLCTDGRCCAQPCGAGERCDVPAHEGTCTPPLPPFVRCEADPNCTDPVQPFCADGFCCDDRCGNGRCDVPSFEGLCIPSLPLGSPCNGEDRECGAGFCSDNFVCCAERCADGFCDEQGLCHPLRELAEFCAIDEECRSRVCDVVDGICCNRRCDFYGEFCNLQGRCGHGGPEAAPGTSTDARRRPAANAHRTAASSDATLCSADCDGDGVVGVAEVIRLVAVALGTAEPPACSSAAVPTAPCVSIDDIVRAVSEAMSGCAASG